MASEVFISFIHEEAQIADAVKTFLDVVFENKVKSFLASDRLGIYAGDDWMATILSELKDAKILVSLLSPTSVARPWVNFEAGAAWVKGTKVMPACFGGLDKGALPKPYSTLQAVNLGEMEDDYYLVRSIAHYLGIKSPQKPVEEGVQESLKAMGLSLEDDEVNMIRMPYETLGVWVRAFS
ncbi:MAG TPA: toll/interleukin-1 receptor domain-containing protein [Terriglobales bacterium]|nr:toll/interleukin-1 receptor domain-containing protein [Terriglobales bacterium]